MALWCATTLDRNRLAKFNVNKAMTLSSLLPLLITAMEEIGNCGQLVLTIQSYHGQAALVSAMNFSYNRICCFWALGLYICVRGFRRAYNGGAYIPGGFWPEYKLRQVIYYFSISKLHNKSNPFQYKLERREAYTQAA